MCCVQLAAATPNWDLQEYVREEGTPRAEVVKRTARLAGGFLEIPETPGLGIEIDEAGMKKHPYDPGQGDNSRRMDGSVALR